MPTLADFRAKLPSLEGLNDDQALSYLQQRYAPDVPVEAIAQRLGIKIAAPEVKAPKRSLMAVANDTVIEAANAAAGTVGAVTNFVSPGNRVSKFIDENIIAPGEASQSDAVRADKEKFRASLENAEGMGDEVAAVGRYVMDSPLQAAAQAAGSFVVPGMAIKGAGALAGAAGAGAKGVARAGLGGGAALGAAGAGGDAAGTAYELAMRAGATEEEATAAARQASVIPGAIGAAGGMIGAERLFAGSGGFKGGLMARALKTAGVEGAQEGIEEGVTQYEGQRAAMPFDATIDPMKGVAGAATLGAVLGAATGSGVSLLQRQQAEADKGLDDLKAATDPDAMVDAALRATNVPLDVPPAVITADGEILPPGTKPRVRNASAIEEIRQLDPAQQQEALGLLATAQSPQSSPAVRRYAQNRLDVLLEPVRQIPVGEVTEADPLLPIPEAQELTATEATAQIAQPPDFEQRRAMGKRVPTGEATELTPEEIELETIPQPDVIEAGGDLPLPDGMAPRTPKQPEPAPAKPMTDADIVAAVVDGFRKTNTPQARAFVQDFDAGRIKPADVLALVGRPPQSPDERLAAAAAQAPKKTDIQPGDILTVDGQPFGTRSGAYVRAKKEGGEVVSVSGGWAVRPKESAREQPDVAGATPGPLGARDGGSPPAAPGGGNLRPDADGAAGVARTGPTPAPRSGGGAAVAVAPGGGPDAALTPAPTIPAEGTTFDMDGKRWTVAAAGKRYVTIVGPDGKERVISDSSERWVRTKAAIAAAGAGKDVPHETSAAPADEKQKLNAFGLPMGYKPGSKVKVMAADLKAGDWISAGGRPARVVAVAPGTGGKVKVTLDNGLSANTDEYAPTQTTERYTPEKLAEPDSPASESNVVDLRGEKQIRELSKAIAKAERDEVLFNLSEIRLYRQTGSLSDADAQKAIDALRGVVEGGDFDDAMEIVDPILGAAGKKHTQRLDSPANDPEAAAPATPLKDRAKAMKERSNPAAPASEGVVAQQAAPSEPAPAEATHKDPGEPAEPVTAEVVAGVIEKAAKNTDRSRSEMKAEALRLIDAAMVDAKGEDDPDVRTYEERSRAKVDKKALDRRGLTGVMRQKAEEEIERRIQDDVNKAVERIGYVTIKVPGDGAFKVFNTKDRLAEFRRKIEQSPGFKDRQTPTASARTGLYEVAFGVESGSGSKLAAFSNMVDEGDIQAALDYAEAVGIDPKTAKLTDVLRRRLDMLMTEGVTATSAAPAAEAPAAPAPKPAAGTYSAEDVFSVYRKAESAARGLWSSSAARAHDGKLNRGLTDLGVKPTTAQRVIEQAKTIHAQRTRGATTITFISGQDFMAGARRAGIVAEQTQATPTVQEPAPEQESPALDLMGFERIPKGNGAFDLRDSNMLVRVEPTERGKYRASMGSAKSGPNLSEQMAVEWAAAYRAESLRVQAADAKKAATPAPQAAAPEAAPTADPFAADYAALVGKTIEQTVTTDDGKTAKLRMDAARALRDFDQRQKTLQDLKACLGRNG